VCESVTHTVIPSMCALSDLLLVDFLAKTELCSINA